MLGNVDSHQKEHQAEHDGQMGCDARELPVTLRTWLLPLSSRKPI
jgi:hypothetical protein